MKINYRYWSMICLLAASLAGFQLLSHGESTPLVSPLKEFPPVVNGWTASELPIEARLIQSVGVSDYLSRAYSSANDDPIAVYVGYYRSQRTGQTIHSPQNCLPGAGWEPVRSTRVPVRLSDGRVVRVNYFLIEKGLDRQLVLYWYQSHGRVIASEYWAKVYLVADGLRLNRTDSALVRLSTPVGDDEAGARARLTKFAVPMIEDLNRFFPK